MVAGGLLALIFYGGGGLLRDLFSLKRGIPRNKKKVSEFIKNNPEKFGNSDPGVPSEKDKREVEEDERRRADKYREFEKLRQDEFRARVGNGKNSECDNEGVEELRGNPVLPNGLDPGIKDNERGTNENRRRVKLDD